ncbi:MAG: hypothetical protein RR263_00920 [Oscillospiraceae bacterium]
MRKIFFSVCCTLGLLCFIMVGCTSDVQKEERSKQQLSSKLNNAFETTAHINYNNVEALLTMSREQSGNYKLEFLQPISLQGISLATQGENITITYKDMSLTMTANEFFSSSVVKMIIESINNISTDYGFTLEMGEQQLTVSGMGENGEFILLLDPKNSNLLSLEIPSSGLKVDFENFKFLN